MNTMKIKSPKTGREITVRVWDIADPKETLRNFRPGGKYTSVKDLSWELLSEKHSVRAMERTEGGDSARNNFALNVMENALDWSLGLKVFGFIRGCVERKKMPKAFKVAAARNGDVFIIGASGTVYA